MVTTSPDIQPQIPIPAEQQPPLEIKATTEQRAAHPSLSERVRSIVDVARGQVTEEIDRLNRRVINLITREQIHHAREGRENIVDRILGRNDLITSLRSAQHDETRARVNYERAQRAKDGFARSHHGLVDGTIPKYRAYHELKPKEGALESQIISLDTEERQILSANDLDKQEAEQLRERLTRLREINEQQSTHRKDLRELRGKLAGLQISPAEKKLVEEYLRRDAQVSDSRREWEGDIFDIRSRLEDIPVKSRDYYKDRVDAEGFVWLITNPAVFQGAKGQVELAKRRLEAWQRRKQEIKDYPKEEQELEGQISQIQTTENNISHYETEYVEKTDSNQEEIGVLNNERLTLNGIADRYQKRLDRVNEEITGLSRVIDETGDTTNRLNRLREEAKILRRQVDAYQYTVNEDQQKIETLDHAVKLGINPNLLASEPTTNPGLKRAIEMVTSTNQIAETEVESLSLFERANIRIATVLLGQKVVEQHPELKPVLTDPIATGSEQLKEKIEEQRLNSLKPREFVKESPQTIAKLLAEGKLTIDEVKGYWYLANDTFDKIQMNLTPVDQQPPITQDKTLLLEATLKAKFKDKNLKTEILPALYIESVRKALTVLNPGDIQNFNPNEKVDIYNLIDQINKTKAANPAKEIEQRLNQALNLLMLANSAMSLMNQPTS